MDRQKELAEHWRTRYDWRAQEERLNRYPQFTTEIDGQRIHVLHARSDRADAKPLLLTHGFPSSVAEFLRLIDPLVSPADGQAFHVVAPSLPGDAFSTPLSATGWTMARTGRAWVELMRQLGYDRYGVHGGDIGGGVSAMVAGLDPEHVIGVHVVTDPLTAANVATFLPGLADRLDGGDPVDRLILHRMAGFRTEGSGYLAIQNSRPQTIGYGLVDSPLLQLAWIAEKFYEWTDLPIDVDQLLTRSACTGSPGPAPALPTPSTSRPTRPTGARHRPYRRASRSSVRTRPYAGSCPPRPTRTGQSSSVASISRRWRRPRSSRRTCGPSSGRCPDGARVSLHG